MSNYPTKFLPLYLSLVVFLSLALFCPGKARAALMQETASNYHQQGWAFQEKGDLESALNCYQKAIIIDPHYAVAYNDAGVVLEALGQPRQAKEMYLKAVDADPAYPNSYSNLALLYEEEKDYANAVVCWMKRATLGQADDPWKEAAQKRLQDIASVYPEAFKTLEESQHPAPVAASSRIPTDNQKLAERHFALAKESFAKGQYVSALKEATMAEYLDSSNAEISAFVETVRKRILK